MIISIDTSSPVPPYEQLRLAVAQLIERGALLSGARLPTVRQLAGDLRVAPGTVARAFRELELGGFVTTRGRHGTFVTDRPPPTRNERQARLERASADYVELSQSLGLSRDVALQAIVRAWDR
jgi:GntR family transcriptional regulator